MTDLFAGDAPPVFTLDMQIACVEREIGYRVRVYARLVGNDQMSPAKALQQIGAMEAVLATLKGLRPAPASKPAGP